MTLRSAVFDAISPMLLLRASYTPGAEALPRGSWKRRRPEYCNGQCQLASAGRRGSQRNGRRWRARDQPPVLVLYLTTHSRHL
ncbi:hypothetical protein BZA05DRAFT_403948 [Tricharina praecox]|uniref:uncharacterized protein n=1 Tax=Tricharina praecox TaxID=43433 RepID=UPI00221F621A|nr:uncharacterized protein BZA05DRAFT_403948 [Tricharina praecox]KAI5848393.1 hypothetical protein BZA05DRAFT_403948 [Tricharina praecox]